MRFLRQTIFWQPQPEADVSDFDIAIDFVKIDDGQTNTRNHNGQNDVRQQIEVKPRFKAR